MNPESSLSAPPKVSVLVPIYNVERYLRQCINSLISQTLQEIEILLLDDGSTDGSARICDEYAAHDTRIRVIHKANSGYGATMNLGLKLARGEYIGIVESDDWAEHDMFESLYTLAKEHNVQVVKSDFWDYTAYHGDVFKNLLWWIEEEKVINPKYESYIFYAQPCIWTAIYSRAFLTENLICFLETPGASYQDTAFNFKVWATAERVWLTRKPYIHYRIDNVGASVKSGGKVFCIKDEWDEIETFMDRYPKEKKSSAALRTRAKFANFFWNVMRLGGEERKAFQKYFWHEYKQAGKRGELENFHSCLGEKLRYMKQICPSPLRWTLIYLAFTFSKIFVKRKIKNNRVKWSFFCGLIRVAGKRVDAKLPSFCLPDKH